jgi:hypothetical protein
MAQPSRYSAERAERLLHELRRGRALRAVCRDAGMPSARTVHKWVNDDCEGFAAAYRQARQAGAAALGRGPAYDATLAARILRELSTGRTLVDVCRDAGMPSYGTVRDWVTDDRHGFAAPYRAALRAGGARWARPVRYDADLAEFIADQLGQGRPLEHICAEPGMPTAATVRSWVTQDRDGFAARYDTMRRHGCYVLADEMLTIADSQSDFWIALPTADGDVEFVLDPHRIRRLRLRLEARNWLLSHLAPRLFG